MEPLQRRLCICFFLLGLVNNSAYVIMIASAKEITEGSVGLVFFCNVFPSLTIKLSSPFWFHKVSYAARMALCLLFLFIGFQLTAFSSDYRIQLLGVCFCAAQSGLGEASFLAMTALYPMYTPLCLTLWSSGTGLAGVFGFAWKWLLMDVMGASFKTSLLVANGLIVCFGAAYRALPPFREEKEETIECYSEDGAEDGSSDGNDKATLIVTPTSLPTSDVRVDPVPEGRWNFIRAKLLVYMIPLFVVYFSEYAMQSGAWAAIGFPATDSDARKAFFLYSNWTYQLGVFISRSSGSLVTASMLVLQIMPVLQTALLVLFTCIATFEFMYGWGLLGLCFVSGLLGGGVYVNAFTRISVDIEKGPRQELALAVVSVADSFGIMFSDVVGLYLQACIYERHGIMGAKVVCPF